MINLLVDSLMADRGLEDALTAAIAAEMREGKSVSLYEGGRREGEGEGAAVPLLHLVRQLLGNATGKQLSALKKVHADTNRQILFFNKKISPVQRHQQAKLLLLFSPLDKI